MDEGSVNGKQALARSGSQRRISSQWKQTERRPVGQEHETMGGEHGM